MFHVFFIYFYLHVLKSGFPAIRTLYDKHYDLSKVAAATWALCNSRWSVVAVVAIAIHKYYSTLLSSGFISWLSYVAFISFRSLCLPLSFGGRLTGKLEFISFPGAAVAITTVSRYVYYLLVPLGVSVPPHVALISQLVGEEEEEEVGLWGAQALRPGPLGAVCTRWDHRYNDATCRRFTRCLWGSLGGSGRRRENIETYIVQVYSAVILVYIVLLCPSGSDESLLQEVAGKQAGSER